jgi:hypothetical protein
MKSRTMKYDELRGVETQATLETKFGTSVSWFVRATSLVQLFSGSYSPLLLPPAT